MKKRLALPVLALTCFTAWKAPGPAQASSPHSLSAATRLPVSGTFVQTQITSLEVRGTPGGTTILEQTSLGTVSGTLGGSYSDSLHVVVQPNGRFSASFRLAVDGTLDGNRGTLTMQAADVGRLIGPTTATFSGIAVVTGASGGLAGTRGVLDIEGVVDLASGLATYTYEGELRVGS